MAAAFSMVCRGGPWPSRGSLRQCGVPRDDASIVPYIGLWYRRVCCFPVSRSVLPPLSKGGGTAAGRDGGIVLRLDAVSKKRHNGRITLPLTTSSGNVCFFLRNPPISAFAPFHKGAKSTRKRSRCRGVRRDEGIPPYVRPGGCGRTGWPQHFPWFVGEGHGPPAGPCIAVFSWLVSMFSIFP